MRDNDIERLDYHLSRKEFKSLRFVWDRIKKALSGSEKTPTNNDSPKLHCPKCGATDNIAQSTEGHKYHCFRCDNYWKK